MQHTQRMIWFALPLVAAAAFIRIQAAQTNGVPASTAKPVLDPKTKLELRREEFEKLTPRQLEALQKRRWQRIEDRLLFLRKKKELSKLTPEETEQIADLEAFKRQHTPLVLQPLALPTSSPAGQLDKLPPPKSVPKPLEPRPLKPLSAP